MLRVPQHHPGHKRRGRGSCAISERPTHSVFGPSSLFRMLSPTIPVHPRNAPVSPIIPVHTQKQGGRELKRERSVASDQRPGGKRKAGASPTLSCSPLACPPQLQRRRATRHSPLSPTIPAPLATAALRVVPVPIFTATSRIHVGAPTILFRERTTASQQFQDRHAMLSSNCALLTAYCELLFFLSPIIPALTSRAPVSSIIPALTQNRGVGWSTDMVTYLKYVGAPTILECGGSPPPLRVTQCRQLN